MGPCLFTSGIWLPQESNNEAGSGLYQVHICGYIYQVAGLQLAHKAFLQIRKKKKRERHLSLEKHAIENCHNRQIHRNYSANALLVMMCHAQPAQLYTVVLFYICLECWLLSGK